MSWTPIFDIDNSNLSQSEKEILADERSFRRNLLAEVDAVNQELCLLNARFEEAFETHIESTDI